MNPLSIAELALSFSTNTCFGLLGTDVGKNHSGKLGVGSIVFGLASMALGIYSASQKAAPIPPLTRKDLDTANEKLRGEIADDTFADEVLDRVTEIQTIAQEVNDAIEYALADVKSRNRLEPDVDEILNNDWRAYYDAFKKTDGYQHTCLVNANWAAAQSHRLYDTLDLYTLAGSVYLSLNQICLMVEWNDYINSPTADAEYMKAKHRWWKRYVHWRDVEMADYRDELAAYQDAMALKYGPGHGNPGFYWGAGRAAPTADTGSYVAQPTKPEPPEEPKTTPQMYSQLTTSVYAVNMKKRVADFISHAETVVSDMEAQLARHRKLQDEVLSPGLKSYPFEPTHISELEGFVSIWKVAYQAANEGTGEYWTQQHHDVSALQVELMKGIEWAGLRDDKLIAVAGFSADRIATFRKTIDNWKATQTAYADVVLPGA
ncbi:hypothetical protein [Roseivivax sediminis]|uniref:Uncharacterized protein n=1 Tax=Roseivivax sediminis TaxID=936889 RepID=A0A1I1YMA1_9RHOB|nr:hypothetical protein [Roseivivax sediminis]SFE20539.1 hypothetical protein SAMN04515678_107106 [Roseivivax sediminis]